MLKKSYVMNSVFITCFSLALVACNHSAPKKAEEKSPAANQASVFAQGLSLYSGQPSPNIRIAIESPAAQKVLEGAQAQVPKVAGSSAPNADVSVIKSDKSASGDALTFTWKDSWRAALNFETTAPLNLTDYMTAGVVEFDLNVIELAKGGLAFKSKCVGAACERKIPYLLEGRKLVGKGWQHLSVPLK